VPVAKADDFCKKMSDVTFGRVVPRKTHEQVIEF